MNPYITGKVNEAALWASKQACSFSALMEHVNATWPHLKPKVRAEIISRAWGMIQKKDGK